MRSVIEAIGSYLPETCLTNAALETRLDTSDVWIRERTGITQRYIAAEGEYTSHLATHAAHDAMQRANITANEIDLIIVATTTPDTTMPATAIHVQAQLGIAHAAAFDLNAACSGFVYAMHTADALMHSGLYRRALVIGAETMSRVLDWEDRRTAILFGDGAGACIMRADQHEQHRGILHSLIASDSQSGHLLSTDGGVSVTQTAGVLQMNGREVFRHAVEKMSQSVIDCAEAANISLADINYIVPHQANARILTGCAKRLQLDSDRFVTTVDKHANTSSASIPLALAYTQKYATLKQGDLVMLTALGAGFTWGSCLIRW